MFRCLLHSRNPFSLLKKGREVKCRCLQDYSEEDASEDNGGVSDPELEVVQVLERERPIGSTFGREKESSWATRGVRKRGALV